MYLRILIFVIVAVFLTLSKYKKRNETEYDSNSNLPPKLPEKPKKKSERSYRLHDFKVENEADYFESYSIGSYIQNNNDIIEKTVMVYNPCFRSVTFINWAMKIIKGIAENGTEKSRSVMTESFQNDVGDIFDIKHDSIVNINYLSLYRLDGNKESLTLCIAVSDNEVQSIDELNSLPRYFAVFERKSQYDNMTNGEYEKISCPHCGGKLYISNEAKCPYCGHIISKSEDDWHISSFKKLVEGTPFTNVGVIIKK